MFNICYVVKSYFERDIVRDYLKRNDAELAVHALVLLDGPAKSKGIGSIYEWHRKMGEPGRSEGVKIILGYYLDEGYVDSALRIVKLLDGPDRLEWIKIILNFCVKMGWVDDAKKAEELLLFYENH